MRIISRLTRSILGALTVPHVFLVPSVRRKAVQLPVLAIPCSGVVVAGRAVCPRKRPSRHRMLVLTKSQGGAVMPFDKPP